MIRDIINEVYQQRYFRKWFFKRRTDLKWIGVDFAYLSKYGVTKEEASRRIKEQYNIPKNEPISLSPKRPPKEGVPVPLFDFD